MTVERLLAVVSGRSLYFASARQFADDHEGALPRREAERMPEVSFETNHGIVNPFEELQRLTKINCWHERDFESVAMWERYIPAGVDATVTKSSIRRLGSALGDCYVEGARAPETIVIKRVEYLDWEADTSQDRSMLGRFASRRREFQDEREIRALLSLRIAEEFGCAITEMGVLVPVTVEELVEEIVV